MKDHFVYVASNGSKYYANEERELVPIKAIYQAHLMTVEDEIRRGDHGPVAQFGQSYIDGCAPIVKWLTILMILLFVGIWLVNNVPFLRGY
jgi:hypothetical protein